MPSSNPKYSGEACTQRKANGDPCQSPALREEIFCHYHKMMGKNAINLENKPSGHAYLPVFEDAVSIQSAITDVCEMMLHRRIETKEASILLYAMQVASTNMAHMNGQKTQRKNDEDKKSEKHNGSDPSSSAAALLPENSSPAPGSLPPGTIQACANETPGISMTGLA
jgi:hypothetical protein